MQKRASAVAAAIIAVLITLHFCGCASLHRAWEATDEPPPRSTPEQNAVTAVILVIGSALACGPCALAIGPGSLLVAAASKYDTISAVDHHWDSYCDTKTVNWAPEDFVALAKIAQRLPPADRTQWAWYTYLAYEYGPDMPKADTRLKRKDAEAFASLMEAMKDTH